MKKKLFLLTTFLISFIMFSNSAMAAQELTCTYKKVKEMEMNYDFEYQKKITQDSNGNIKYFSWINETIRANPFYAWNQINAKDADIDFDKTSVYDSKSKILIDCPPCIKKTTSNEKFEFSDLNDKDKCKSGYLELESKENRVDSDFEPFCFDIKKEEAQKKIDENNYLRHCFYKNEDHEVTIYFNENDYTIIGDFDSIHSCIKGSYLNTIRRGECPLDIRLYGNKVGLDDINKFSSGMNLQSSKCFDENGNPCKKEISVGSGITSCSELFGDDLIKEINKIMNLIRIIVPILLLIFGITDFFKSTFDTTEDNMKKNRDRFIKRIIAAIIVFIVPIFVNLVLKISNQVWSNISPDTCVDQSEE